MLKLKPIALTCALLFAILLVWLRLSASLKYTIDFPQFYFAAQLVESGNISKLHDTTAYEPLLDAAGIPAGALSTYFNRPAFAALLYWPLAFLSFPDARLAFILANCLLWILLVYKLPTWFDAPEHLRIWLLCFFPFVQSVGNCQDTLLLTLLIACGYGALSHQKEVAAGVLFSLGLFKPHLLVLIPVLLMVERRWKAFVSFAVSGCALAGASVILLGLRGVEQWISLLAAPSTDVMPHLMVNLRALAMQTGGASATIVALLVLSSTLVVFWRGSLEQRFSASILTTLLLCPHVYLQDYSLSAIVALTISNPVLRYGLLIPWYYFLPPGNYAGLVLLTVLGLTVTSFSGFTFPTIRFNAIREETS